MSDFLFNISRGRAHEMHRIIDSNVLANSALVIAVIAAVGLESDDVLRDYDTLAAILAASNNEPTQAQYNRKVLTDADIAAATVDDTNNLVRLTYPSQTWTSVVAGDTWAKVLTCIDYDTTTGTDTDIVPITAQDMLINGAYVIPAGVNIQWTIPNGYYLSSS
jgi:hypothetical protein